MRNEMGKIVVNQQCSYLSARSTDYATEKLFLSNRNSGLSLPRAIEWE